METAQVELSHTEEDKWAGVGVLGAHILACIVLADFMSRRAAACGRAELLANFLGGAVWGVFRENANCGDPPG